MSVHKTPGQVAYEADVAARPTYHDGQQRPTWFALGEVERWSWDRNPTPRWSVGQAAAHDKLRDQIANTGDC